jgi:hypothetical protein
MKSLKNISLILAATLITFGAMAQTSAQQNANGTAGSASHVTKDKTKTKEKPNGTTKTVTKSKPTKKVDSTTPAK